jgi:hypothetical protein
MLRGGLRSLANTRTQTQTQTQTQTCTSKGRGRFFSAARLHDAGNDTNVDVDVNRQAVLTAIQEVS